MLFLTRVVLGALILSTVRTQQPAPPAAGQTDERTGLCDKAATQLELNQCTAEQFKVIDARLNSLYSQINRDIARDTVGVDKLKTAQQAWIKYRDLHCEAARHQAARASMAPMIWADCMTGVTLNRIEELKFAYPVQGRPRD